MIQALKPYPDYKDSGVAWLGDIPIHWNVNRGKWLFAKKDRPCRADDDVVTCFRDGIVTLRRNRRIRGFTESLKEIGYQGIFKGDLVIHVMDAFAGAIGVSDSDGKGSPVYQVLHPRRSANVHYYAFVLREMARSQWILALAKGIRERSTDFRYEEFASQLLPIPPLVEQNAIVRYLDYMDRRIRRYINIKKKLVALLEEQKQVIINQAVTRGIEPNVCFKPSRVEWLSDVPVHWEVRQLGRMGRFSKGNGGTKEDAVPEGVPCIRYGDLYMYHKFFIRKSSSYITQERAIDYTPIHYGDVLFAGSGEIIDEIGKSAVNLIESDAYCGGDVILFRPSIDVEPQFLGYATDCPQAVHQKACMGRGITVMHIYGDQLKYLWISLPPTSEQAAIIKDINGATTKIDIAVDHSRRDIELIREYRTRLIADIVTGKLDVRDITATLPDVLYVPETTDAIGELIEDQENVDFENMSEEIVA